MDMLYDMLRHARCPRCRRCPCRTLLLAAAPPANFDPGDPRFDATDCPETACHARHLKEQYKHITCIIYKLCGRQEYLGAQSQDV